MRRYVVRMDKEPNRGVGQRLAWACCWARGKEFEVYNLIGRCDLIGQWTIGRGSAFAIHDAIQPDGKGTGYHRPVPLRPILVSDVRFGHADDVRKLGQHKIKKPLQVLESALRVRVGHVIG